MWTAGFLTAVGLAQAVFLGGKSPRVSSMIGGILFTEAALLLGWATGAFGTGLAGLLPIMLVAMIEGAILGYAAGTLVGGVFLVAHLLRRMVGGSRR